MPIIPRQAEMLLVKPVTLCTKGTLCLGLCMQTTFGDLVAAAVRPLRRNTLFLKERHHRTVKSIVKDVPGPPAVAMYQNKRTTSSRTTFTQCTFGHSHPWILERGIPKNHSSKHQNRD